MAPSSPCLVVIGASAGGVGALRMLASGLPAGFNAAVLVVLHIGAHESLLPDLIAADCALDVSRAVDGEVLKAGTIRIAPPDVHLTVADGVVRLTRSPKENFARPAIDALFRSAALDFDSHVIGVILTGMLDDGTAGLQAIKCAGGIAVVQDPRDAVEPSMPASALRHVKVDHCVPLGEMPALLVRLVASGAARRTAGMGEFDVAVGAATDGALWSLLRTLHERAAVLDQLAGASRAEGRMDEAAEFDRTADVVRHQAQHLRALPGQPGAR